MALAIPVLLDYERPTPTTGIVHADNVPAGITCRAYYISLVDSPPAVVECGDALGDGNPGLEINLNLTGATWSFFGIVIPKPIVVFIANEDTATGNFSRASVESLPQMLDFSAHAIAITNLRRSSNNINKVQLTVTGMPSEDYEIILMWVNLSGDVAGEIITGNGYHLLTAEFDPSWPYSFIGFPLSPAGTFLRPISVKESFTVVLASPTLDRVLTEDGDRQMEVYWTPPTDQRVSTHQLYYRNKSRNEPQWNVIEATSSPVVVTNLKRGNVYETLMVAQDGIYRSSLPTQVLDVFVRG